MPLIKPLWAVPFMTEHPLHTTTDNYVATMQHYKLICQWQ